jgi:2-C-methyl-D-erythritol 4-phosphate cytidylyltransferase
VQQLGEPVEVVLNQGPNPKITFVEDLAFAERCLEAAESR